MLSILVINSKGGSGKTTLATNLASYYASKKFRTTIMDYDPQSSCLHWLRVRESHMEAIHGANAAPPRGASSLHNLKKWVPVGTQVLVIDAPAGVKGLLLQEMVRRSNFIVIPVVPSPIDIHATADFIQELLQISRSSIAKPKISVVANRVRSKYVSRESLENFFSSMKLPFLTSISDSDNFLRAAGKGLGVFEMNENDTYAERRELLPILNWLNGVVPVNQVNGTNNKVVNINEPKKPPVMLPVSKTRHSPIMSKADR